MKVATTFRLRDGCEYICQWTELGMIVATTFRLRDGCEYSKKWGWAHGGYWAVCANLGGNGAFWAGRKGGEFGEKEQAFWRQEDLAAGRRARTSRGLEGVEGFAGGEGKQGKEKP